MSHGNAHLERHLWQKVRDFPGIFTIIFTKNFYTSRTFYDNTWRLNSILLRAMAIIPKSYNHIFGFFEKIVNRIIAGKDIFANLIANRLYRRILVQFQLPSN